MACCKCCCGEKDCAEGDQGKCCCGGAQGTCCTAEQFCCDGECQQEPCETCETDEDCQPGEVCCEGECCPANTVCIQTTGPAPACTGCDFNKCAWFAADPLGSGDPAQYVWQAWSNNCGNFGLDVALGCECANVADCGDPSDPANWNFNPQSPGLPARFCIKPCENPLP